ncbi:hypothetical protein [Naasia lichenicola]|uniref:AbiEi antitoxin C-terminal domain-containing protein n=1 Tax=Naasia lichenicola TaxID=2565933 RepID=A0A4S4FHX3_9MICO|nr:hypothetical protein [Naasia lichenicola]THG29701.1 hypothetical protein E6C64_13620 [Naasia lichenicola]
MEEDLAAWTASELRSIADARPERRLGADLVRARRGVYLSHGAWQSATSDARYSARIAASALTLSSPIYSHESALRLLGLPSLRPWPTEIHLISERRSGGRSQDDVRRHCLGLELAPVVEVGELTCTSPARTALDIALSRSFLEGVVVADAAFARDPGTRPEFVAIIGAMKAGTRGLAKAMRVLDFADERCESPGESISRVEIVRLGFQAPELQTEIRDRGSLIGRLDFHWPSVGVGGEFDGRTKYLDARMTQGRTASEIVVAGKDRENRLRRHLTGFARWNMAELRDTPLFTRILVEAGVPRLARGR